MLVLQGVVCMARWICFVLCVVGPFRYRLSFNFNTTSESEVRRLVRCCYWCTLWLRVGSKWCGVDRDREGETEQTATGSGHKLEPKRSRGREKRKRWIPRARNDVKNAQLDFYPMVFGVRNLNQARRRSLGRGDYLLLAVFQETVNLKSRHIFISSDD